jgi:hypothetical protein
MLRRNLEVYALIVILNAAVFFVFSKFNLKLDYKAFYSAGKIAMVSPTRVYDFNQQYSSGGFWSSKETALTYYHPPHELIIFAPLSLLPFKASLLVWRLLSLLSLVAAAALLAKVYRAPFRNVLIFSAALFGVTFCLLEGQDSLLLLLLLSASLYSAMAGSELPAGCLLAMALFKPQIPLVIGLAMLVNGRRRFVIAFVGAAAIIAAASFAIVGSAGLRQMLDLIRVAERREVPGQMISFRGFFSLFSTTASVLSVVAAIALVISFLPRWRKTNNVESLFSSAILVGALSAFHFHAQDTSLLVIPLVLLASRTRPDKLTVLAILSLTLSPLFLAFSFWGVNGLFTLSVALLTWKCSKNLRGEPEWGSGMPLQILPEPR